jgi:hypothetical protein
MYIARLGKYSGTEHYEDLEYHEHGGLPEWANDDPLKFWKASDDQERENGTVYREVEYSLPRELALEQRIACAHEIRHRLIANRHAYQLDLHNKVASDGGAQPHVHFMWSERVRDDVERGVEQYFRRYNAKSPNKGGCRKESAFERLQEIRRIVADVQNEFLERYGFDRRVDHRTLKEQGIDREPGQHRGPEVRYMKQRLAVRRQAVADLEDQIATEIETIDQDAYQEYFSAYELERTYGSSEHRFGEEWGLATQQDALRARRGAGHGLRPLSACRLAAAPSASERSTERRRHTDLLPADLHSRGRISQPLRRAVLSHQQQPVTGEIAMPENAPTSQAPERPEVKLSPIEIAAIAAKRHPNWLQFYNQLRTAEDSGQIRKGMPFAEYMARREGYWTAEDEARRVREAAEAEDRKKRDASEDARRKSDDMRDKARKVEFILSPSESREIPPGRPGIGTGPSRKLIRRGDAKSYDVFDEDLFVAHVECQPGQPGAFRIESDDSEIAAELGFQFALEQRWPVIHIHGGDFNFQNRLLNLANDHNPPIPIYGATGKALNLIAHERDGLRESATRQALEQALASAPRLMPFDETGERGLFNWWHKICASVKAAFTSLTAGHPAGAGLEPDTEIVDRELADRALKCPQSSLSVYRALAMHSLSPDRASAEYQVDTVGAVQYAHWLGQQGQPLPNWPELVRLAREHDARQVAADEAANSTTATQATNRGEDDGAAPRN